MKITQGILTVIAIVLLSDATDSVRISTRGGIKSEHVNFVLVRLAHLYSATPNNIRSLRVVLDHELNESPRYKSAWDEAIQIFNQRRHKLVTPGFEWVPEEYHIALIAYTLHNTPGDGPFFSDFNKQTRELCNSGQVDAFPYKSFYKLLTLAIDALSEEPKFQNTKPMYYRGANIGFELYEDQVIAFQSFTSTTVDISKAEEYAQGVTLFQFEGPIPNSIYLYHHSGFPGEQEVLVSPYVVYRVQNIKIGAPTRHTLSAERPYSYINV